MTFSVSTGTAGAAAPSHHSCNLCGSAEALPVAELDRDRKPLRTVICTRCGLVRTDPRPDPAALQAYYSTEYRLSYKGSWRPKPKHVYRAGRVARARWQRLRPTLGKRSRVLDVGASSGEFVHILKEAGLSPRGIEPNVAYSGWAREVLKLPVVTGDWDGAEFAAGEFEAITLFHVVEHLADPRGALTRLAQWLTPDGLIVVEVPNVESPCGSPSRRFHFAHLHNFNLETLKAAGEAAGLRVVQAYASPDGGNITAVFTPEAGGEPGLCQGLPGNAERVLTVLGRQSELSYLFSPGTWRRLCGRLGRTAWEWAKVWRVKKPQLLLDA
jgi:2-polyprenyl-3-methyl-5-hydroxy-6-metoxy-1,4-benzoquinol methylase